ncbi:MAG: hypothetical protein HY303_11525 [Candidatus Wallbacteria bacterium]|nr:hypothetical protein [Candidatus Wallbacteria bacterium]
MNRSTLWNFAALLAFATAARADTFDDLIARYGGGFSVEVEGDQAALRPPGIGLREGHFGLQPGRGLKFQGHLLVKGHDTGVLTAVVLGRTLWLTLMNGSGAYRVPIEDAQLPPDVFTGLDLLADPRAAGRAHAAANAAAAYSEHPDGLHFDRAQPPSRIVLQLDGASVPVGVLAVKDESPEALLRLSGMRPDANVDLSLPLAPEAYAPRTVEQMREVPRQLAAAAESARKTVDTVKQSARSFLKRLLGR